MIDNGNRVSVSECFIANRLDLIILMWLPWTFCIDKNIIYEKGLTSILNYCFMICGTRCYWPDVSINHV